MFIASSPFCAHSSSYLQQKWPKPNVRDLMTQISMLHGLKKLGSSNRFKRPTDKLTYKLTVVVFTDASRSVDHGQQGYIARLLMANLEQHAVFHLPSWNSRKSKRPVKRIGSAEILAAGSRSQSLPEATLYVCTTCCGS